MRPRLPLRRPRRDRADQCRRPRGRDADADGGLLGSARRRAAGQRHRSASSPSSCHHGRSARPTLIRPALHAAEGSCASHAGARRCGPIRPLLGRRRRAARGAVDAAPLDSPADAARRHDARGSGHDEATTDGDRPSLARGHLRFQSAGRRSQAAAGPDVPRHAHSDRCRRPAALADDPRQGPDVSASARMPA